MSRSKLILSLAIALVVIATSTFVSQHFWWQNGLRSLQAVNEPRVPLVANALKAEISRQDHLPVVLSLDPDVRDALLAPDDSRQVEKLNRKLKRINDEAETRALYVIKSDGSVLASDDWDAPGTRVGRNLANQAYVADAIGYGRSSFLGTDPSSGLVRYFIASAVGENPRLGVAAVRIEFDTIEAAWQSAGEQVFVTDATGRIFLANNDAFKNRTLRFEAGDGSKPQQAIQQSNPPDTNTFNLKFMEKVGSNWIVRIRMAEQDVTFLYQSMRLPEYGWTIHRLSDLSVVRADQRDGAIIGATVSILVLSILLYFIQRHRALAAANNARDNLRREVDERTRELRTANSLLHSEIDERSRTELRLLQTQNTLVQAGKLAALGQMSAALAHEINQPLTAIRTFIASSKIFAARGNHAQVLSNLNLINGLADRMASITTHLKTFARKSDPGRPEPVDVARAVDGALFLIEGQIKAANVQVEKVSERDIFIAGYAVQLEQVLVNLLQNALHSVASVKVAKIAVEVFADGRNVQIKVSDNGPGISADIIDEIFDPFFTTKPVGKGLGLGLSISYGIIQSFDGRIQAVNRDGGGLDMIIDLPRVYAEDVLLHA